MFSRDKPELSEICLHYMWRVLRLSFLLAILAMIIVNSIPVKYQGTAELTSLKALEPSVDIAFRGSMQTRNVLFQEELNKKWVLAYIAKDILKKLQKFRLTDLDSEVATVLISNTAVIQIKRWLRQYLPFLPQQDTQLLSTKQLRIIKSQYTQEDILQGLRLSYLSEKQMISFDFKDSNRAFALIVANLAAEVFLKNTQETQNELQQHLSHTVKQHAQHHTPNDLAALNQLPDFAGVYGAGPDFSIVNNHLKRIEPNRLMIVGCTFLFSLLILSLLVVILLNHHTTRGQARLLVPSANNT